MIDPVDEREVMQDQGASASRPGSHPPDQAAVRLGALRFDPSRIGDAFGDIADGIVNRAWGRSEEDCSQCGEAFACEDSLCRDCWNEINGQFGVGA